MLAWSQDACENIKKHSQIISPPGYDIKSLPVKKKKTPADTKKNKLAISQLLTKLKKSQSGVSNNTKKPQPRLSKTPRPRRDRATVPALSWWNKTCERLLSLPTAYVSCEPLPWMHGWGVRPMKPIVFTSSAAWVMAFGKQAVFCCGLLHGSGAGMPRRRFPSLADRRWRRRRRMRRRGGSGGQLVWAAALTGEGRERSGGQELAENRTHWYCNQGRTTENKTSRRERIKNMTRPTL